MAHVGASAFGIDGNEASTLCLCKLCQWEQSAEGSGQRAGSERAEGGRLNVHTYVHIRTMSRRRSMRRSAAAAVGFQRPLSPSLFLRHFLQFVAALFISLGVCFSLLLLLLFACFSIASIVFLKFAALVQFVRAHTHTHTHIRVHRTKKSIQNSS